MAAILNLPFGDITEYKRGDSFPPLTLTLTDENDAPIPLAGAIVRMDWKDKNGIIVRKFNTNNGTILISNPSAGEITIPQFKNDTQPGVHDYDVHIEQGANDFTPIEGKVTIKDDVTK